MRDPLRRMNLGLDDTYSRQCRQIRGSPAAPHLPISAPLLLSAPLGLGGCR